MAELSEEDSDVITKHPLNTALQEVRDSIRGIEGAAPNRSDEARPIYAKLTEQRL